MNLFISNNVDVLWCFDCAENLPINFCLLFTSGAKVLFTILNKNKTKPHWRRHHDSYSITQIARPHKLMAEIELNIFNRIEMLAWQIRTQIYMPYNTIITTQKTFNLNASLCAIIMNWPLAAQIRANLSTEVSFMGGMGGKRRFWSNIFLQSSTSTKIRSNCVCFWLVRLCISSNRCGFSMYAKSNIFK